MRLRLQATLALAGLLALAAPLTAVHAAGLADLAPTSITALVKPARAAGTCEARISAAVTNSGTADVASYAIQFTVDDKTFTVQVPRGTGVGRTTTKSVAVPVTLGSHTVTVTADPANAVPESDETNNSLSSTITCR